MKKLAFSTLILLPVVLLFTTCSMVSGPARQKKAEVATVSTVVDMTDDPWNIPAYNATIVWQADTRVVRHLNMSLFDGYVYMFDDEYYGDEARFVLTKIDAETGASMWKTPLEEPRCMQITEPLVSGKYVFAFQDEDIDNNPADILMYDNTDGTLLAKVLLAPPGKESHIYDNAIVHDGFLYFGYRNMELDGNAIEHFLGRLEIAKINPTLGGDTIQNIQPEIMWTPQTKRKVWAKPLVHNNTIYCMTHNNEFIEWDGRTFDPPVELAGIDIDTKSVVFYKTINYDTGLLNHPLLIYGDILYIRAIVFLPIT